MTPIQTILAALAGRGHEACARGERWSVRCPAHDDNEPSLSLAEGADGRALVKCHAGCATSDVMGSLGLTMSDLMPSTDAIGSSPEKKTKGSSPRTARRSGKPFGSANDAVAALERRRGPRSMMWTYHDAHGEPVGVVVRWSRPDGKKDIRPAARHADGWRIGAMPEPRPLYELSRLTDAERVYVCEGEKAADAVRSLGVIATTSSGGSQAAGKTDWQPLAGKDVIILPDNDAPGRKYAADVVERLKRLKPAPNVRIVELPGLPVGGDAVEWIEAHGDAADTETMRREMEQVVAATVKPDDDIEKSRATWQPRLTCLADIEPREVAWLWQGRFPLGRLSMLAGRPGEGKSFLTADLAARVSTGTPWPDGSPCERGSVILMSGEDDPSDTIRPRLDAHHADNSRVHLLTGMRCRDEGGEHERCVTFADVDAIEKALRDVPSCKLVVVDPIGSYLGGKVDAHRDNEVRGVLAPIADLAERYGVAVLLVAHVKKSTPSHADDAVLGSRAFTGIARCVWHLHRDKDNPARRLMLTGKNNLAAEGSGLAFTIGDEPARITWERDPVDLSANDVMATESTQHHRSGPESVALAKASEWLLSALAGGPRPSLELFDEWMNGQSGTRRTLERAKASCPVEAYRPVIKGPWHWRLIDTATPANQSANHPKGEELGGLGGLANTPGHLHVFEPDKAQTAKLLSSGVLGSNDAPEKRQNRRGQQHSRHRGATDKASDRKSK